MFPFEICDSEKMTISYQWPKSLSAAALIIFPNTSILLINNTNTWFGDFLVHLYTVQACRSHKSSIRTKRSFPSNISNNGDIRLDDRLNRTQRQVSGWLLPVRFIRHLCTLERLSSDHNDQSLTTAALLHTGYTKDPLWPLFALLCQSNPFCPFHLS